MTFQPFADRVLIEPKQAEEKTASGIYIPNAAREKPQQGTVVAIGNGSENWKMIVNVGDTVMYGKFSGSEIELEGKKYLMMRENEIFGRIV